MIKTIDLFAGAGGLSFGFLMTGEHIRPILQKIMMILSLSKMLLTVIL